MRLLKIVGPWIISAALCLVAVELLGAAVAYWNTKSLVYLNVPKPVVAAPVLEENFKRHIHPYFGYTGDYSRRGFVETNSLGFLQMETRQIPFVPKPNDFVVFVFGGSVAARLATNSQEGKSLQQTLESLPQIKGKNVVLFNVAQGPGKQPQQLMLLAYLIAVGQHIDLVLNMDGTLEFVTGVMNFNYGVDPIFPPVAILQAIGNELTPMENASEDYYELAYTVTHARAELKRYSSLLDDSTTGIAYLKNRLFRGYYDRILAKKLATYNEIVAKGKGWEAVRKRLGLDMPITTSKEKMIEDIFNVWLRCSDQMKNMANSIGAKYLHVVHPNMYYSKKVYTEAEKALMTIPEVRLPSVAGLAFMESRAEMLESRGIVSALALFDDIPDTVYNDPTGHMNKLGETMLAELVAREAGLRLGPPSGK